MSDTSQGEGWWQASDGKWYAPEQHPDFQQPTQPVDQSGPPTEATPPPTEAMPPAPPGPPTQAMPPPGAPPPGAPPGTPPPGAPEKGSNNKKWIIPAAIAAVIIAVAAFLLLRNDEDNSNVATATDASDQQTDKTDSTSSSSSSKSSSSKSSSSSAQSKEFVDPATVQNKLLTAEDIGSEFTDQAFTTSSNTTDPCGKPNARAQVPPTKDVGSTATEPSQNLLFEEEVVFHKNAADNKKAFDIGVNSATTCNQGTQTDSSGSVSSFTISDPKDVSDEVGVTEAVEFTIQSGDTSAILVGVRLDNCIATFLFQFPTSAGESAQPDEISIVKDGVDRLLS
jgi:hypothetical protein